ncbi:siderophore-interacting protein [Ancylobacter dichloromethanicus]|uniref:Siderophore-interacting protein n=1 Tax=Ancylobacter dichloromethanicus TaxID=518825 RepID=A0A9W6J881_9HYPH|nr:siderophore-interacting protein [Ancylobacter dichloromethanicus]MBS7554412.1 siderophore-interacting protein [Ancylobacter dichloromethanicus]GLK71538.1 siderophore-interacting protein [Ancylobacter dichloromethanicus]
MNTPRLPRLYRATASVVFPRLTRFLDPILDAIATHDMSVTRADGVYQVTGPFGRARLDARPGLLHLAVETTDRTAFNRLKHALVGPISFIAASERLDIVWTGDMVGAAPPDDLRVLEVAQARMLTPRMRRITFHGDNLARYDRPDQLHCRLIFQPKGVATPEWPALDDRGRVVWPERQTLATRVYTIRRIDAAAGEIAIDFALHERPGPATRWAMAAEPGDIVGILGPAANGVKPATFHVLAGDETGLPGVARILEQLPGDARGLAFIEIDNPSEQQLLAHPPGVELRWLRRDGAPAGSTSLLPDAVRSVVWPDDRDGVFFWGGCEHGAFRQIHRMLRREVGLPSERQTFYSHWNRTLSEEEIIATGAEAYLP